MNRNFEIVVVGSGVVGLTVAALLATGRHRGRLGIRLVDAGPRPRFDATADVALRVSAISAGSSRLFASLGAWDEVVAARAGPFREMRVWDASRKAHSPDALHFDAAEFALPELGFIVENVLLQEALLNIVEAAGAHVEYATPIVSMQPSGTGLVVDCGGRPVTADLVIGADGAGSSVRRYSDIAVTSWSYPQSALVTHLQPELDHCECAWQRFLPAGPLALLPLADGRVSVVWSTTPEQAEEARTLDAALLGATLTEASDRVLGDLTVDADCATFPLKAQYANRYVAKAMVLVGDAAHSIHPLAGQGANLGISDAAVLARTLDEAIAAGEYPGDLPVLRRYERARKGANSAMLHFVDALNRLFASPSAPVRDLRRVGMRLFNSSGPLRRHAAAVALGLRPGP